uniref:NADH-ubiquinone oxidoreductase chain 2 n=1 Tax=Apatides fortis TaxID=590156 RepID=D1G5N5_APAFO|nr:NADH dehydrogenase subunit 2 [Apatides fortis]ACM45050.1 NADH dehydrogenase subunit 2 [Apatides fortis]
MTNLYKTFFTSTLVLGTITAVSSYSWMGMWMGLEINLLSIIPLMSNSKNQLASESSLKYFITQAIASSVLLFSMILLEMMEMYMISNYTTSALALMSSSLLMKTGAAPFHFWFPEIMEGLNWINSMIMLTWQKIAPMMIIMNTTQQASMITLSIITSMIIGGILGLNQSSLRKILAYSSINHIGWMLAALTINSSIWLSYFLIYSLISFSLIWILKTHNIFYLNQIFLQKNPLVKLTFMINFLSMGGIPPFIGFLPKWITINALAAINMPLTICMVILTLITLYYYVRTMIPTMTLNTAESKNTATNKTQFSIWWINWMNILALILCTLWFNLI